MVPIEELTANAVAPMLDTATGHVRETLIVSMFIPRATIERLNLERVDASDAMANFVYEIRFLKTKGFQPVEEVAVE